MKSRIGRRLRARLRRLVDASPLRVGGLLAALVWLAGIDAMWALAA